MKSYPFQNNRLIVPVIINTVIFFLLSLLHFYWAFGGKLWFNDVLPTSSNGQHKFLPTTNASVIIAFGFLLFALITVGTQGLFDKYIRRKYFRYSTLIISLIFFARAVGDFKFIGFFKKVKFTRFGMNDTQIFSPLCLLVALISLLIYIFSREPDI